MIVIDCRRTLEGLETLEAGIVQAAGLAIRDGIKAAEESEKATTLFRDKTGETRASIRGQYEGNARGFVSAGGMSKFLENGTRAHVIHGRPMLRFVVNGETVFRRMVRHPGTQARPFVTEARARGEWAAHAAAEFYAEEAIRRVR